MALNRGMIGIASAVITAAGALGVNKYQISHLPVNCLDAVHQNLSPQAIQSICPLGFDDHTLANIILLGGVLLTLAFVMSPLRDIATAIFDFIIRIFRRETV